MIIINATGHLGADAEVRESNGRKYTTFRLCSTIKRKGQEISTWISAVYHGDGVAQYLKRGTHVLISGEGLVSLYDGKAGKGVDVSVNVDSLQLLSAKQSDEPKPITDTRIFKDEPQAQPQTDDELPF